MIADDVPDYGDADKWVLTQFYSSNFEVEYFWNHANVFMRPFFVTNVLMNDSPLSGTSMTRVSSSSGQLRPTCKLTSTWTLSWGWLHFSPIVSWSMLLLKAINLSCSVTPSAIRLNPRQDDINASFRKHFPTLNVEKASYSLVISSFCKVSSPLFFNAMKQLDKSLISIIL